MARRTDNIAGNGAARSMLIFAMLFVVIGCWSLATPLIGSPDESSHIDHAAAVVRGQWSGVPFSTPQGIGRRVQLPTVFTDAEYLPGCFAFKPKVSAACEPPWSVVPGSPAESTSETFAGSYNPAYYALVGWPTLIGTGSWSLYAMRLCSALLCAGLLAAAFAACRRLYNARLLALGLLVGVTPMTLFFASAINPNGAEIAAAAAVWTGGLALLAGESHERDGMLVATVGLSAALLVNLRSLSPAWLLGIALLLFIGEGRRARVRMLARRRDVRTWIVVDALALAAAVTWTASLGSLSFTDQHMAITPSQAFLTSLGKADDLLRQMVGVFGWLDTYSPFGVYLIWAVAVGAVVTAAALAGSRRRVVALSLLLLAVLGIPILLEAPNAAAIGYVWQGRYTLPIAVGVPILAAAALRHSAIAGGSVLRRLLILGGVVLLVGQVIDFGQALRRYEVGLSRPFSFSFLGGGAWSPPLPGLLLLVVFSAGLVVLNLAILTAGPVADAKNRLFNPPVATGPRG